MLKIATGMSTAPESESVRGYSVMISGNLRLRYDSLDLHRENNAESTVVEMSSAAIVYQGSC